MTRAFTNPAHCEECGKRFDSNDRAWAQGKGGITGRVGDHADIPPIQRGRPFAYCRRCLETGGYDCTASIHDSPNTVRERRRATAEAVAQAQRAQFTLLKGGHDEHP